MNKGLSVATGVGGSITEAPKPIKNSPSGLHMRLRHRLASVFRLPHIVIECKLLKNMMLNIKMLRASCLSQPAADESIERAILYLSKRLLCSDFDYAQHPSSGALTVWRPAPELAVALPTAKGRQSAMTPRHRERPGGAIGSSGEQPPAHLGVTQAP